MNQTIVTNYGHKLRVRACGLLVNNDKILLIRTQGIKGNGYFLSPPGGGLELGESLKDCVKKEFFEECNLTVNVHELILINEFNQLPLHAIEFFFKVSYEKGVLKKGFDPEHEVQIIESVNYYTLEEIKNSKDMYHPIFESITSLHDLFSTKVDLLIK